MYARRAAWSDEEPLVESAPPPVFRVPPPVLADVPVFAQPAPPLDDPILDPFDDDEVVYEAERDAVTVLV